MKNRVIILTVLMVYSNVKGQSYLVKTSDNKYHELQHPTLIHLDSTPYTIVKKIPFKFMAFGKSVFLDKDTQTIVSPSFIVEVTSSDSGVAFSPFYGAYVSARNRDSTVSYEMIGNAPNRVLKFQWKNVLLKRHKLSEYANFQIWFQEADSRVYFHIGPNHIIGNNAYKIGASDNLVQVDGPQIGIYVVDMQGNSSRKVELAGNPQRPVLNKKSLDKAVNDVPKPNTLYTFIPTQ